MAVDMDALFKTEAFSALGAERLQLVKNFAYGIENKKAPEIIAQYMRLNQDLSRIKPLSQGERAAVAHAIRAALPDADRPKFDQIFKMLRI
jgi:hypothetical protein